MRRSICARVDGRPFFVCTHFVESLEEPPNTVTVRMVQFAKKSAEVIAFSAQHSRLYSSAVMEAHLLFVHEKEAASRSSVCLPGLILTF